MFDAVMDAIARELNLGLCRRDISSHWACRCTVPGPGMRRAGEITARFRHGGEIPLTTVVDCPRLLAAEGMVAFV